MAVPGRSSTSRWFGMGGESEMRSALGQKEWQKGSQSPTPQHQPRPSPAPNGPQSPPMSPFTDRSFTDATTTEFQQLGGKRALYELIQKNRLPDPTFNTQQLGSLDQPYYLSVCTVVGPDGVPKHFRSATYSSKKEAEMYASIPAYEYLVKALSNVMAPRLQTLNQKGRLQELCQKQLWPLPEYEVEQVGTLTSPKFVGIVRVASRVFKSEGCSPNVKEAQHLAAMVAFEALSAEYAGGLNRPIPLNFKGELLALYRRIYHFDPVFKFWDDSGVSPAGVWIARGYICTLDLPDGSKSFRSGIHIKKKEAEGDVCQQAYNYLVDFVKQQPAALMTAAMSKGLSAPFLAVNGTPPPPSSATPAGPSLKTNVPSYNPPAPTPAPASSPIPHKRESTPSNTFAPSQPPSSSAPRSSPSPSPVPSESQAASAPTYAPSFPSPPPTASSTPSKVAHNFHQAALDISKASEPPSQSGVEQLTPLQISQQQQVLALYASFLSHIVQNPHLMGNLPLSAFMPAYLASALPGTTGGILEAAKVQHDRENNHRAADQQEYSIAESSVEGLLNEDSHE